MDFSSAIRSPNFGQFLENFVDREARQPVQLQFENGVNLNEAEPSPDSPVHRCPDRIFDQAVLLPVELDAFERFRSSAGAHDFDFFVVKEIVQILPSIRPAGGTSNDLDDVVHVIERDVVAEQDVLARFGLAQLELRAPPHDFDAVLDEELQQRQQAQLARLAVHDREQNHAERFLHLRELEQMVQNNLRFFAALHFDDDAHALAVGFVAHVGDAFDFLGLHQLGDALDQARLVDLVGNLGDDDVLAVLAGGFDRGLGAHDEAAAAGLVRVDDAFAAGNVSGGREVRPGNQLHDFLERRVRLFDQQHGRVNNLAQVVRRDVGRHADGDAARAIDQQIRRLRRQHDGLFARLVEVRNEVHRLFFEIGEHFLGDFRQARFGVPHRRGRIAVHRAVISLPVDQRVAHVERLREAHQRGVNDGFAVRMVVAGGVAADLRALAVAAIRREAQVVHRDQDAPLHGLQAVAHIGNRARHDHAHRVIEVRLLHLGLNFDRDHLR